MFESNRAAPACIYFDLDSDECAILGRHDHDVEKKGGFKDVCRMPRIACACAFRPCVGSCGGDSMMRVATIGSLVHSRFDLVSLVAGVIFELFGGCSEGATHCTKPFRLLAEPRVSQCRSKHRTLKATMQGHMCDTPVCHHIFLHLNQAVPR